MSDYLQRIDVEGFRYLINDIESTPILAEFKVYDMARHLESFAKSNDLTDQDIQHLVETGQIDEDTVPDFTPYMRSMFAANLCRAVTRSVPSLDDFAGRTEYSQLMSNEMESRLDLSKREFLKRHGFNNRGNRSAMDDLFYYNPHHDRPLYNLVEIQVYHGLDNLPVPGKPG